MKRLLAFCALFLVLAACTPSAGTGVTYQLDFDVQDAEVQKELTKAAVKVIERRLNNLESPAKNISVKEVGGKAAIAVVTENKDVADQLTAELAFPFSFRLVRQVPDTTSGAIVIQNQGSFMETTLTEEQLIGAEAAADPDTGKGAVRIELSPQGAAILKNLGQTNEGDVIALLVRGALISKTVAKKDLEELIIRNIPTPAMGEIFADDVNVGVHVTFTPVP